MFDSIDDVSDNDGQKMSGKYINMWKGKAVK